MTTELLTTVDDLRTRYRAPAAAALRKVQPRIDSNCASFIAHAPFVVIGTSDTEGRNDVSPKGGPPGFVAVLDEHTLAIPDLSGNNRLDSLTNLVSSPGIALLFMIPGLDETLRVNGRAAITTDPDVLATTTLERVKPRVAVLVEVEECYIHCAKALRRGGLWQPEEWPDRSDMPTPACILTEQAGVEGLTEEQTQSRLDRNYATTMWEPGGEQPPAS